MDSRSGGEQVPKQTRRVNLGKASALGVLRCLTGLLQAVLLTLDRAGVTRQEACTLEGRTIIRGYLDECARDSQTQCACLTGRAATVQPCNEIGRAPCRERVCQYV